MVINMRKTVRKLFWIWDFDKEEKWLNEMAAKGLALISVGYCRYEFEDCTPGEYQICLEFFKNKSSRAENEKYIEFLEETGAEHVGTYHRWGYFRKKSAEENFRLFSDNASRIGQLTRVIRFIYFLCGINLYCFCYNMFLYFRLGSRINIIGTVNLPIVILGTIGIIRLCRKRKKLRLERRVFDR